MKIFFPIHLDSGNRGCEAIAKGTALVLKEKKENLIGLCTNIELDHRLKVDDYITLQPKWKVGKSFRIKNKIYKSMVHDDWKCKSFIYRHEYSPFLEQITKDDIMASTGGDMMCYGENQVIYTVDYLHKRGVRSVLWGCSIGESNLTPRKLEALKQFELIYARETLTQEVLANHNINAVVYPDPAFVLETEKCCLPACFSNNEVIGINLSNFVMGGFSLDSNCAHEVKMTLDYILKETSLHVLLIPHVLWNGQDDRIVCNALRDFYDNSRISVLDSDSLNYCQIRYVISKCKYFMGARTHSVISAYSTCVPTIALGYSIKSKGIAKDVGMPVWSVVDSTNIKPGKLLYAFQELVNGSTEIKSNLSKRMKLYRSKAWEILSVIRKI